MTPQSVAGEVYLNLDGMDEDDYHLFYDRLEHARNIIDTAGKPSAMRDSEAICYRIAPSKGVTHDILVARERIDKKAYLSFSSRYSDGKSDYIIHSRLRPNEPEPDLRDADSVLDHMDIILDEADLAFTRNGRVGPKVLARVEAKERACLEVLNALVHANIELGKADRFVLEVHSHKLFSDSGFYERVDDKLLEFLVPEVCKALDQQMPLLSRVTYERSDGISHYRIGELKPQQIVITAADMPSEAEIVKILRPLAQIPQPHLLDQFTDVEG